MSVVLNIVCPDSFCGSPDKTSARAISLLTKAAEDGLIRNCSRSMIFGVSPNKILNRILNDSSVPLVS